MFQHEICALRSSLANPAPHAITKLRLACRRTTRCTAASGYKQCQCVSPSSRSRLLSNHLLLQAPAALWSAAHSSDRVQNTLHLERPGNWGCSSIRLHQAANLAVQAQSLKLPWSRHCCSWQEQWQVQEILCVVPVQCATHWQYQPALQKLACKHGEQV